MNPTTSRVRDEAGITSALEAMPYGEYIVGSRDVAGAPNGMMADWVMQIAFVPHMVAVSFENDAHTLANIRATRRFTINLLPQTEAGRQLSAHFAQPYFDAKVAGRTHWTPDGIHHKLDGVAYHLGANGCPVLDDGLGWMDCEADAFIPAGDHTLVTASVVGGNLTGTGYALASEYTGWTYAG